MAPRFDPENRTLSLAVADLLDKQLLRSIGFANRGGYERLWLGQAIHSRYQEQALEDDPTYRREVTIRHTFQHRGWQVTIHGRIDGLRRALDDALVVEEIKSVRRGAKLGPTTRELYARQAALYAWLLTERRAAGEADGETRVDTAADGGDEKADEIRAELVLIEIGSDAVEREEVELHLKGLGASVKRRLNQLIRAHRAAQAAQQARAAAGDELAFPYTEMRPGQQTIIDTVDTALAQGEHLLVEAPTGIGKTVASLFPAMRYALTHNKRIYVLTAKTLQQEMSTTVLRLLNTERAFHSLQLRAKAKMCANDQVLCHEEYCAYARDYYLKVQKTGITQRLLEAHETLLPDAIYATAREDTVCPFEISLELSGHSQAMVCDYNYTFDPYVALSDFGADTDLSDTILIIDEIHNLVDRGRRYYSPTLSAQAARQAGEEVVLGGAPIHRQLFSLTSHLAELIEDTVLDAEPPGAQTPWAIEQQFPEDQLWQLRRKLDEAFVDYLEHRRETRSLTADDRFVTLYFDVLKFLNALLLSDSAFSHYVERQAGSAAGSDCRFRILCKDPSRFLGAVINRCHSVIGLSATLSPHDFYRDLLGFDPARTAPLSLPSPFPPENRQVVIDAAVATTYRERPDNYPLIAERVARFADAVPGNCLCLMPSYRFLAEVAGRMQPQRKRVLVQEQSAGDRQRDEILTTLRTAVLGDVLLLAVAGGVFAEGVDYPGDVLRAVAVVGPCLPGIGLEQQLLQAYYDERFERGFEYAFVVPGMTRVIQAAGRLIRSPTDSGVIALFDRRFLYRTYRRHLPADWLPEGGARALVGEPDQVAERFFRSATLLETP